MDDDMFITNGFLESLISSRQHLTGSPLLEKLDSVIEAEIELALIGTNKAKAKAMKGVNNLRPIK